jgi:putative spermidine/putrescine transport system substrate-binding protein
VPIRALAVSGERKSKEEIAMFLKYVVGALFAVSAFCSNAKAQSAPLPYAGQTLRVAIFGGSWQQWQQKVAEPRFKAMTGANVEYTPGSPVQFMPAIVAAKGQNVPFDVSPLSDDIAPQAAQQGLILTDYDAKLMPNLQKLPEVLRPTKLRGPSDFISLNGVVYDPAKFRENGIPEPNDWDVLANPKLAGHVAIPDITFVYRVIYAAINYWKTGDRYNVDGTLDWVRSLKDPIIYGDFATLQTRFNSGEIWAVVGSAGYIVRFRGAGKNMAFIIPQTRDERGGVAFSTLNVVKGTTKAELAQIWIDNFLSTEVQTSMVKEIGFAPTNMEVTAEMQKVPDLKQLVLSDESQLKIAVGTDWSKLSAVYPQWIDKWNRVVRR